jgi:hypothetical protein
VIVRSFGLTDELRSGDVREYIVIMRLGRVAGLSAKCQPRIPALAVPIPSLSLIEQALLDAFFRAPAWLAWVK